MNNSDKTESDVPVLGRRERDALLDLIAHEIRIGATIEAAAERYKVPLKFAQKATSRRAMRRKKTAPTEIAVVAADVESLLCLLAEIENRLAKAEELLTSAINSQHRHLNAEPASE